MKQVRTSELIDQPTAPAERVAESMRDLARLNRWLGGTATVVHQVRALLDGSRRREALRVLDVGAGGGDILVSLSRWLGARDVSVRGVALDLGAEAVSCAARRLAASGLGDRLRALRGDALRLPFATESFDVSYCSTFLHHFDDADAVAVLGEMARVSAVGLVVSDLSRSGTAYAAARLLAETVWRGHPCTRHDGPASVRASYTPEEVRRLAERAGLSVRVERQPVFRWALRWRRT